MILILRLKKGELVALFGETGKGKSTFLDVFWDFTKSLQVKF